VNGPQAQRGTGGNSLRCPCLSPSQIEGLQLARYPYVTCRTWLGSHLACVRHVAYTASMSTQTIARPDRKAERLSLRVHKEDKELLTMAAALRGLDATAFVTSVALESARRILAEARPIRTGEDGLDALLAEQGIDPDSDVTEAMRDALERYRQPWEGGRLTSTPQKAYHGTP
jgi:uncharacterized protein (DUF1778 family)